MEIGRYDSQYSLFFPSFGMTDITASFQDGGTTAFLSVQFKQFSSMGVRSSLKTLYHSLGKPSLPGHLFDFNLPIADPNSSFEIGAIKSSFCNFPIEGRSNDCKNC